MSRSCDPANRHWRVAPLPAFSADQKDWVSRGGSLTRHLQALGDVRVRVVREAVDTGWLDEAACIGAWARTPVWAREIVLSVDDVPMVAAHSIVPLLASRGVWQAIRRLRTRPLADLLYSDGAVSRSALASRRVGARHPLHRLACRAGSIAAPTLIARRSVFGRHGAPLVVTECFLPAFWARLAAGRPAALPAGDR